MPSRSKRVNPRYSNGSRRRALRRRVCLENNHCHLCGYPISYDAPHLDKRAFVLDEVIPVSKGGSPYEYSNVRAAHRCCNGWRGDKPLTTSLKMSIRARYERTFGMAPRSVKKGAKSTSRDWLS